MKSLSSSAAEVTLGPIRAVALSDGCLGAPLADYAMARGEAERMLRAGGATVPPVCQLSTFLIMLDGRTVLVDTGAGPLMEATAGQLPAALASVGVAPEAIDAVVLTHMHGDHIAGLARADGAAMFPHATVHVSADEVAFWVDRRAEGPPIVAARAALVDRALGPYAGRVERFAPGPLWDGVEAVALPGHTPGHTGLIVGGQLLIAGDVVHLPELQFPRPEITTRYDVDPVAAERTRRNVFARAAAEDLVLAGMHLRWPPFVRVTADGAGYAAAPIAPRP